MIMSLILSGILAFSSNAADFGGRLYVADDSIRPGETSVLSIQLENNIEKLYLNALSADLQWKAAVLTMWQAALAPITTAPEGGRITSWCGAVALSICNTTASTPTA